MLDGRARLRVVREQRRLEVLLTLRLRAIEELSAPGPRGAPAAVNDSDERESRAATHRVIATVLRERLAVVTRLEHRLATRSYAAVGAVGLSAHGGPLPVKLAG